MPTFPFAVSLSLVLPEPLGPRGPDGFLSSTAFFPVFASLPLPFLRGYGFQIALNITMVDAFCPGFSSAKDVAARPTFPTSTCPIWCR